MPTQRRPPSPAPDPAKVANQKVLADRQARLDANMKEIPDLGLGLKSKEAASATEFFDQFDKKAFGRPSTTTTRWVYGPDPLIDESPQMLALIEREGLEAAADLFRKTILLKEHEAMGDEVLRRGVYYAIQKFGAKKVADSFAARILKIPARQVEYETGPEEFGDPLLMGGNVLREVVDRYGKKPGMSYRFMSQRCIDVLGMRGYQFVIDEKGQVAKAGTLMLAEIPAATAAGRARHYAEESRRLVRETEEQYMETAERTVAAAGRAGQGSRPLRADEIVHGNASESEGLLGANLPMGVSFDDKP
jgi:hypothetical protein